MFKPPISNTIYYNNIQNNYLNNFTNVDLFFFIEVNMPLKENLPILLFFCH